MTSPGDSVVSLAALKVTMRPSRARLIKIAYSGFVTIAACGFGLYLAYLPRRNNARLDLAQALGGFLQLSQCLPLKGGFQITQLDVELTHGLPQMRDLGLQVDSCASTSAFSIC